MSSKRRVGALLVVSVACYVAANVAMVNLVPILHRLVLTVEVVDGNRADPIPGAAVGWAGGLHTAPEERGVTGPGGSFEFTETVQENPMWVWPQIGRFGFDGRVLRVQAPGYRTRDVRLSEVLPDVPYCRPIGHVRVILQHE